MLTPAMWKTHQADVNLRKVRTSSRSCAIELSIQRVRGLDCLDGTPIIDIKPAVSALN
jgi:tRNA (Thr-GGU) A37 N-methylase